MAMYDTGMKRRDFLKTPGYFVAAAALGKAACSSENPPPPIERTFSFPQDVASGDPRATSVVLWTRVVAEDELTDPIPVAAQVSETEDFATLLLDEMLEVDASSDYTLRLVVTDLTPGTSFYYRFLAGTPPEIDPDMPDETPPDNRVTSIVGRTMTAPDSADVNPVNLAWVSCQHYAHGVHGAYRQMILDDEARDPGDRIQFVLYLGDFVYETWTQGLQGAIDENFLPIEVEDRNGDGRAVEPFPDGAQAGNLSYAVTVADYRHLYKQYLRDPDLRAARARWPFIHTWDDHEFSNDAWQSQANYTREDSLDEASQTRRVAASQAWFEYMPVNLGGAEGVPGVTQHAADFAPVEVTDAPYTEEDVNAENLTIEDNNVSAIGALTLYRSFRFGQHVELVVTDLRSYRSDHPIPEENTQATLFFHPRGAVPTEMVDTFDAGMTANGGNPPESVLGGSFPNPRTQSPPGTMLGAEQKQWWKETMRGSDATWKLWGNSVPLTRVRLQDADPPILFFERLLTSDAWDGYHTERTELLTFLRDNSIANMISLAGDLHGHFAGALYDDFNQVLASAVANEFVAAGISSNSLFSQFESATRALSPELRQLVTYDSQPLGGDQAFVNNLDVLIRYGAESAQIAAITHNIAAIESVRDSTINQHLKYVSSDVQGYGLLTVTDADVTATLVTIERPILDNGLDGPGVRATATVSVSRDDADSMTEPALTGAVPFPFTAT